MQEGIQMALSLPSQHERIHVVRADTGETIQITHQVEEVQMQQEVVAASDDCEQQSMGEQEVLSEYVLEEPQCQSTPTSK